MTQDERVILAIHNRQNMPVEEIELDTPADLVVIDKISRVVKSKCVWCDLCDVARIKRLIVREQKYYWNTDSEVVAVHSRSVSLGAILLESEIIKL